MKPLNSKVFTSCNFSPYLVNPVEGAWAGTASGEVASVVTTSRPVTAVGLLGDGSTGGAGLAIRAGRRLGWLVAVAVALEQVADRVDVLERATLDRHLVAEVAVDAGDDLCALDGEVDEVGGARALLLAVAAGAVQLADVLSGEVADGDGADAVVLNDLVVSIGGAASGNSSVAIALEREGVFADINPPTNTVSEIMS